MRRAAGSFLHRSHECCHLFVIQLRMFVLLLPNSHFHLHTHTHIHMHVYKCMCEQIKQVDFYRLTNICVSSRLNAYTYICICIYIKAAREGRRASALEVNGLETLLFGAFVVTFTFTFTIAYYYCGLAFVSTESPSLHFNISINTASLWLPFRFSTFICFSIYQSPSQSSWFAFRILQGISLRF